MQTKRRQSEWSAREVRAGIDRQRFEDYGRALEAERRELAGLYEDETTWLAETLNGSMRNRFTFNLVDGELTASDGRQLRAIFENSKQRAQELAASDPRMAGEIERAEYEWQEFLVMGAMAHDRSLPNTVVVNSPVLHGLKTDIHGYQPSRGLGWSRVITRNDLTGEITITSQTLDGDDRDGYNAMYTYLGYAAPDASTTNDAMLGERVALNLSPSEQTALPDVLMNVYDSAMNAKHGGAHRAGRQQASGDTWQFTLGQADLIKDHLWRIAPWVSRDKKGDTDPQVASMLRNVRYDTAATLKRRYERGEVWTNQHADLASERQSASGEAQVAGESFNGCGFGASGNALNAAAQLESLGFGARKVRGACPVCRATVEYDPCDPSCSECGATGKDPRPKLKRMLAKQAYKAHRDVTQQRIDATKRQAQTKKGDYIRLPNGSVVIVRERMVIGGVSRYYESKDSGARIDAAAVLD